MFPKVQQNSFSKIDNYSHGTINDFVKEVRTLSNHPVHMINKDMQMSPSAFIPFCEFGGNMSSVGVKMRQFDFSFCNCFQAKLFNDQQCYEVDLDRFSNNHNKDKELKLGFYFMMD